MNSSALAQDRSCDGTTFSTGSVSSVKSSPATRDKMTTYDHQNSQKRLFTARITLAIDRYLASHIHAVQIVAWIRFLADEVSGTNMPAPPPPPPNQTKTYRVPLGLGLLDDIGELDTAVFIIIA